MFKVSVLSERCCWSSWFLSSLSFEQSEVITVEFEDNSSRVKIETVNGNKATGYFRMPCLVTSFAIHLALYTKAGLFAKGWVSRQALSETDFRRLSRWVLRQRRKALHGA